MRRLSSPDRALDCAASMRAVHIAKTRALIGPDAIVEALCAGGAEALALSGVVEGRRVHSGVPGAAC